MIQNLQQLLVVACLDQALMVPGEGIPSCNRAAIELLVQMGGHFTVTTRYSPKMLDCFLGGIPLTEPAIASGGTILYDTKKQLYLDQPLLPPESAKQLVWRVMERFPEAGVAIFVERGQIYLVQSYPYSQKDLLNGQIGCIIAPFECVPRNWTKVQFMADPEILLKIQRYLNGLQLGGFHFRMADTHQYEVLPAAAGKVRLLQKICEQANIPIENTVVIGGCHEDLELMSAAGYAAAVDDAPNEVKLEADSIFSSSILGGAGECLYSLVKRYT